MKKPPPLLTPRIIADLCSGDECADPDHPGLRVRRPNAARGCFYRYRAHGGALREIKLGEVGPMALAEARKALGRLKLERERGFDPQLEKQQARAEARRKREAEKPWRATRSRSWSRTTSRTGAHSRRLRNSDIGHQRRAAGAQEAGLYRRRAHDVRAVAAAQFLQSYRARCARAGAFHRLSLGRSGRCAVARY